MGASVFGLIEFFFSNSSARVSFLLGKIYWLEKREKKKLKGRENEAKIERVCVWMRERENERNCEPM